jgi:aspartate beta-hydroxylase
VQARQEIGTHSYILQTARRHYANLIDAWHYDGRTGDAHACAELAAAQGVWEHPLQRAREYLPGLDARPLHDPDDFWFIARLEEQYPLIRTEIEGVLAAEANPVQRTTDDNALILAGDWKQAHLFRDGAWQENVAKHFPVTRAILSEIPEITTFSPGVITVSRVLPGTHIMPHCGPTNAQLRVHLPLIVPPDVSLRIGERQLTWEEGRCMAFDESFEHEVWHRGSSDRVVLILDTVHPDLGGSGGDAERVRQHRIATEAQILDFMRESGLERVELCDGGVVLHPDPALHELARRYMELTGIEGASLDGDDVTWHRGA